MIYICLKKDTYNSQIPTELQSTLGWNNQEVNDAGEVTSTTAYRPTWKESAFAGLLGNARMSNDGAYYIVKGNFSMKEGELSAIASLGASMAYPNNSVLSQKEAKVLVNSSTFTGE